MPNKMPRCLPKQRSGIVRDLHSAKYRMKVFKDPKQYNRTGKHRKRLGENPESLSFCVELVFGIIYDYVDIKLNVSVRLIGGCCAMSYKLFIDDERDPVKMENEHWLIARTSEEAILAVTVMGMPTYISFDHDLGGIDTSMVFVDWLISWCLDNNHAPNFDFYVHSQNPVGVANINGRLHSFKDFWLREKGAF